MESQELFLFGFGSSTSEMVLRKYVEIKYDNEGTESLHVL